MRNALLVVVVLAAGCSRPAAGGWRVPEDPATPGTLSIAYFETDPMKPVCTWWQLDPLGGSKRALLSIGEACDGPTATWSPDGSRAAITNDPASPLYEVALASGRWRQIPRPPGEIERLFYRDGALEAWTNVPVPKSILSSLPGASPSATTVERSYRLDDDRWRPAPDLPLPDAGLLRRFCSEMGAADPTDLPKAPESSLRKLPKLAAGDGDWRELGGPALISTWSDTETVNPFVLGAHGYVPMLPHDGSSAEVDVQGHYALFFTDVTRLYDGDTGECLWTGGELIDQASFWPFRTERREPQPAYRGLMKEEAE